ncbi:hypothetical protein VPH35_030869 [Triticum aestivum]
MHQEAALLGSNALVAWLDRDVRASTNDIAAAIVLELGMLSADIDVVKHFSEAFLVRFFHQHHCADAAGRRDIPFGATRLQLRPWRLDDHSETVDLVHHVRLCLDGMPLQAWDEAPVAQAIGSGCSIDYIEPASKLKTNCEMLAVWAWTASPACVPRVNWVTLPARAGAQPAFGRRGLERRVIIHLSIHEDPTQGPRVVSKGSDFTKGVVDGERQARDPRERISRPVNNHRRDRDDDRNRRHDDRDRRGCDGSRNREGWGVRIRRSLSRKPRDSSRDQGRDNGRGGRHDDDAGHDRHGHRRSADVLAVLAGSSFSSAEAARAAEMLPLLAKPLDVGRGHDTSRHPSPRLCEPPMLLLPVPSPSRPPGFEASPTPPLPSSRPVRRTPSPVRRRRADATGAVGLQCLAPLFGERQAAILPVPTPAATPPRAPAARRKTLAGVTISEVGGALSLHKTRVTARPKATPVARAAEILVCRSPGIVKDGEDVTAAALDAFADRFKERLSPEVLTAMRGLFKLDDTDAAAVEEALLTHGGGAALDLERIDEEPVLQQEAT